MTMAEVIVGLIQEMKSLNERFMAATVVLTNIKQLVELYDSGHLDAEEAINKIKELLSKPVYEERKFVIEFHREDEEHEQG